MTSPGEGVTVFTSPHLSAGAPALSEAKGLIDILIMKLIQIYLLIIIEKKNLYIHLKLYHLLGLNLYYIFFIF